MTHNLLALFREPHCKTTQEIAEHLGGITAGWDEARVYNELAKERNDERLVTVRPPIRCAGFDRNAKAWAGR